MRGLPIKKCPGVNAAIPSSSGRFTGMRGRLLRQASIWASTVVNSSKVSFTGDATRFSTVFVLFTADSQMPPKVRRFFWDVHVLPLDIV